MTKIQVRDFKKAYKEAELNGKDTFSIQGLDFVTNYAKYVLQYVTEDKKLRDDEYIVFEETKDGKKTE